MLGGKAARKAMAMAVPLASFRASGSGRNRYKRHHARQKVIRMRQELGETRESKKERKGKKKRANAAEKQKREELVEDLLSTIQAVNETADGEAAGTEGGRNTRMLQRITVLPEWLLRKGRALARQKSEGGRIDKKARGGPAERKVGGESKTEMKSVSSSTAASLLDPPGKR